MPAGYLYLGEAAGGRIIRAGVGFSQVGDPYQLEVSTWDDRPVGDDGECIFRWLVALVKHSEGYAIDITPLIDGAPFGTYHFSAGAPPSTTDEVARLRCWPMRRGNRIGAIVKSTSLLGPTELVDVQYGYAPIRTGR